MTLRLGKATASSNFASRGVCSRGARLLLPLCICLLSLFVAGGVFVHNVLSLPARTPILTLSGVYGPEWDLNCWVAEDLRCVGALRQGTFAIHELPEIDHLAGGFWDEADDTIRTALSSCDADVPLLVYVNLHGAVNDDGEACFVPPKASVNDASTWFPVYELLNRIEQLKVGHAKPATVLLLESGKIRSHWPAGITNNSFADRLEDVVDRHHRKHPDSQITILSSTARGQRSLASPHGDGNHFTRAVVAGLSGAADGRGKEKLVDGQVDSEELYRYVRQRVAESAEQQEVQQTPVVFQAGIESPLPLAQTMHSDPLKSRSSTAPPSSSELERLESVLQTVGEIGALNPIAVNPHAWAQVQRTTHGLLQSVSGGSAVRATKERWYSRLARQAESLRQEMSGQLTESSMLADLQADRHGKTIWSAIEKAPSRDAASAAIRDVDSEQAMPVPMLHAMLGRPDLAFWKSRDLIQRTAKTQVAWLQTKSVLPDGVFPAAETICEHIFEARRSLADAILADQSPAEIEQALVRFETEVARRCDELATLRTAWILRDRVYVELPFLIQWMDESSITVEQKDDASRGKISDVVALDALLTRFVGDTTTSKPPSMDEIAVASKRAAAFLGALTARREQERHSDEVTPSGESPCTERCQLIAAGPIRSANKSHSGDKKAAAFDSGCAECLSVLLGIESEEVTAKQRRRAVQSLAQTHAIDPDLDGQWRRVVSLIVDDDFANVIESSRRASRQQRLASRVNEVLDDFWYAPPAQNSPYFVATAKALIGLADSTADENPVWRTRKRDLTAKLESRHLASSKGLVIKATSQPSFDSEGTQLVSVHLNRANGQTDMPFGTANLVLRQKGSQHFSSERTVVIDPNDTQSLQLDVSLQAGRYQESLAELRFRGNTFQSDVMVSDSTFGVTATHSEPCVGATVTISDAMDSRQAVCFVLDCSASMNDAVEIEAARSDSTTAPATKFDAARSALFEMMRRLEPEDTEVGLVLYGHRMAVGGEEQGTLLQKRYFKKFPFSQSLRPFEDVDAALPTGRFDSVQLEVARQHFDAAAPWGQTPLYLAISRAIDDVARTGDGALKNVIVISDGRNYQFNPTPSAIVSIEAVIQRATRRGVRLHVIGFGLPKEDQQVAAQEFSRLAKQTGGESVADVREATELLRRLEQFTSKKTCVLTMANGETVDGKFGETVSLSHVQTINTPIKAAVNKTESTIYLSPGDNLRLIANQTRQSLSTVPYLDGSPRFADFETANGNVVPARIGVQIPELDSNHCRFRASIQRSDHQVAERPAAMWIEVRATNRTDAPPTSRAPVYREDLPSRSNTIYRIGDVRWLSGMSCPVAEFSCLDWPVEATGFELQAWCASEAPETRTIQWNDADLVKKEAGFKDLPGFNGITHRVSRSGREVQVAFQYETSSVPDSMLMVQLDGIDIESSQHWYDETRMQSFHRFTLNTKSTSLGLDSANTSPGMEIVKLRVNTIAELKSRAVKTVTPINGAMYPTIATLPATNY